jgi:N-acetylglucosamine-6-sulfatase
MRSHPSTVRPTGSGGRGRAHHATRLLAVLGIGAAALVALPQGRVHAAPPPNIVLILTDDQRIGLLPYMPNVQSMLVDNGVTFNSAVDNNPLCCPARATILTGQTSGHNAVWWNQNGPFGGFSSFKPHESKTVAVWLHDAGYRTGLMGKYMNGYSFHSVSHVPAGWDDWQALVLKGAPACHGDGYFNYCLSNNGVDENYGSTQADYSTTVLGQKAAQFIQSTPSGQPLFLEFAPRAPHLPTTPESQYATACRGFPLLRPPSYNIRIVDGPPYMQRVSAMSATVQKHTDRKWIDACRTLLSVDDQVANIVNALQDSGRLSNTLIMFASDNGLMYGEHRWRINKIVPYEESVRIPVIIRYDPLGTSGTVDGHLITDMDYTATFMDAAGVQPPAGYQFDGQSLLPLIGGSGSWAPERGVLIEHFGGKKVPAYCGVRTLQFTYVQYSDGFEELYDLTSDPYQLTNVAADSSYSSELDTLRNMTHNLCTPPPPGYVFVH